MILYRAARPSLSASLSATADVPSPRAYEVAPIADLDADGVPPPVASSSATSSRGSTACSTRRRCSPSPDRYRVRCARSSVRPPLSSVMSRSAATFTRSSRPREPYGPPTVARRIRRRHRRRRGRRCASADAAGLRASGTAPAPASAAPAVRRSAGRTAGDPGSRSSRCRSRRVDQHLGLADHLLQLRERRRDCCVSLPSEITTSAFFRFRPVCASGIASATAS